MGNQKKPRALPHAAFYGVQEIAVSKSHFVETFEDRMKKAEKFGFNSRNNVGNKDYPHIKLLDLFFSDTIPQAQVSKLFELAKKYEIEIQILLLDPFSDFAKLRANVLGKNDVIRRLNKGLKKIKYALTKEDHDVTDDYFENQFMKPEFIYELLDDVDKLSRENSVKLSLLFTKNITEFPIYIISQFVFKGIVTADLSAAENPWTIYVDDPLQTTDMYDIYKLNFDTLWPDGYKLVQDKNNSKETKTTIFISHGHDEFVKLKVKDILVSNGYKAHLFEDERRKHGLITVPAVIKEAIERCGSAILILSNDDLMSDQRTRARQNVIHELGYCQAYFGDRVLILVEQGVEQPSNLQGLLTSSFSYDGKRVRINEKAIVDFLKILSGSSS